MIKEHFNKETGYMESLWIEDVVLDDIVQYIRRTKANKDYPRKLKILTDATKANMKLRPEDLKVIAEENALSVENYDFIADAFVADTALVAALSTLYKDVSKIPNYYFKVFSSFEAGLNWLNDY